MDKRVCELSPRHERWMIQSYRALSYSTLLSCSFHELHSTAVIIGTKKSAVFRARSLYDCRPERACHGKRSRVSDGSRERAAGDGCRYVRSS